MFRNYLKITRSTLIIYFKKLFLWKIERERDWREKGNTKKKKTKNKKQKNKQNNTKKALASSIVL